MDIIKKGFGEQLKLLRKINNLTQEALAENIGINLRQLARIEAGESFVSSDTILKICKALKISPKKLFDFEVKEELIKTGTGNTLHFNVIKHGNLIKLITNDEFKEETSFDSNMLAMAQRTKKNINVDEIIDGKLVSSKTYTPNGEININTPKEENLLEKLKINIEKLADDKQKLEFIDIAYRAIYQKEALQELKTLIKGIELTQH